MNRAIVLFVHLIRCPGGFSRDSQAFNITTKRLASQDRSLARNREVVTFLQQLVVMFAVFVRSQGEGLGWCLRRWLSLLWVF
jgi:hypothetical protein